MPKTIETTAFTYNPDKLADLLRILSNPEIANFLSVVLIDTVTRLANITFRSETEKIAPHFLELLQDAGVPAHILLPLATQNSKQESASREMTEFVNNSSLFELTEAEKESNRLLEQVQSTVRAVAERSYPELSKGTVTKVANRLCNTLNGSGLKRVTNERIEVVSRIIAQAETLEEAINKLKNISVQLSGLGSVSFPLLKAAAEELLSGAVSTPTSPDATAQPQVVLEQNETLASMDQREPHRAIIEMITQAFFVANKMQPEEQKLSAGPLSKVTNAFNAMLIGRHPEKVAKDLVCEVCSIIKTAASLPAAKDELSRYGLSLNQVGKKSWPILKQTAEILHNTYSGRQS